MPKNRYWSYF